MPRIPASGVAAKRLAEVETRPGSSHQHEFNAGKLRTALGISDDRISGKLTFLFYSDARSEPIVEESNYTLYDARLDKPNRSEFRLYYSSEVFSQHANPGDLLVMFRQGPRDICAIVAAGGSSIERRLESALELGITALKQFTVIGPRLTKADQAELFDAITAVPNAPSTSAKYEIRHNETFRRAIAEGKLPSTYAMAVAAHKILRELHGRIRDADEFLAAALDIESDLFFAIENELGTSRVQQLFSAAVPTLDSLLKFAMSIQQARKARRGHSLQHHFAELLNYYDIPYTAQSESEAGEIPDFLIPSAAAYHDDAFPNAKLRMVACKSTVRDRWRQILREADRIKEKYLLTVDPDLTGDNLRAMRAAGIMIFLPRAIASNYPKADAALMESVAELISRLQSVVT